MDQAFTLNQRCITAPARNHIKYGIGTQGRPMTTRTFDSNWNFRLADSCALALSMIFLITSHNVGASTNDPGLVISRPGFYDGHGRAVGYINVNTSDALVTNYHVTGYGPGVSCISYSGDNITIRNVTVQKCGGAGVVFMSGTRNVLEDSFIADPTTRPGLDSWAIYQAENAGHVTVRRVKAYGSGFSAYAPNGSSLIEDNDFLIPDSYRTDCHGNRQIDGPCNCGEFGIAPKSGRNVIRGNRISGYRTSDPICGGSGSPGAGIELAACAANSQTCRSEHDVVDNNVISNSHYGIYLPPQASKYKINDNFVCRTKIAISDGYSQNNSAITDNTFYDNGTDLEQYGTASALTLGNKRVTAGTCPPQPDTKPDVFTFMDVVNVAVGTLQTSNTVTITGINHAAPVSVTGGEYSIGCSNTFTTATGIISNNQTVCVRHTSTATHSTSTNTTLIIGAGADTFTSTTLTQSLFDGTG